MAAVTELSFLLFALINYIHAQELILIKEKLRSHTFKLPENTNSCLISRCVGEEKLVLWNTSDLWSNSSSVPQHLKQRLVSSVETSSYTILHLTHSDSGRYREECWTEGNVTHDNNFTITVCSSVDLRDITARLGETVDLSCEGAADNLDIQWLKQDSRYDYGPWNRVFGDKTTSVMDNVRGRYQVVTNTSALRVSNITTTDFTVYRCLVMNQQQCVSSNTVWLFLPYEIIYGSVGESAVLPCSITDSTDEQPPRWSKMKLLYSDLELHNQTDPSVDQNYSLVFSSLMLNHSGQYSCKASIRYQQYDLFVCPKFIPPAVELFSEGEEVTLRCRDWRKGWRHYWFIKSHRTEGRIFNVPYEQRMSRVSWYYDNGSLVISNISVGDAGEYWCVVYDRYLQCLSTERTVLVYMEPFGIYSTFFKVRCSVLSVLLLMLCAAVVAVNLRTRRGGIGSAPVGAVLWFRGIGSAPVGAVLWLITVNCASHHQTNMQLHLLVFPGDDSAFSELLPPSCSFLNSPRVSGRGGGLATLFKEEYRFVYRPPKLNKDFILSLAEITETGISDHFPIRFEISVQPPAIKPVSSAFRQRCITSSSAGEFASAFVGSEFYVKNAPQYLNT
ncbi:uncharacterized protein LOC114551247 [Perca flavescens]|uniref:uncharacterized protein LOC114551247 n=1 Tax=Perca flavescens TaxID=8167 RepID=UPI00106E03C8|nr:uncharacterized protein LOC114551247 [Perca flavescens]